MQWQKAYELGIPTIDDQHRELIKRVAGLKNALNTHHMYHELAQALKFVVDYTQFHFKTEEDIFKENDYPCLSQHQKLHADLIARVTRILSGLKQGKHLLPSQFIDFLENWVFQHILNEDKQFGLFLAEQSDQAGSHGSRADRKCTDITAALKRLGQQFNPRNKVDFADERAILLENFIRVDPTDGRREIKKYLDHLDDLGRKDLIAAEEAVLFRSRLFKSHLLDLELQRRRRLETKLSFLDNAMESGLISADDYAKQRASLGTQKAGF